MKQHKCLFRHSKTLAIKIRKSQIKNLKSKIGYLKSKALLRRGTATACHRVLLSVQ
jgi:hypothetical protein